MNEKIMKKIAYLAFAATLTACGGDKSGMPTANNEYAVAKLQTTVADLNTSYPATIKGMQDIEIRPRVAGHITQLLVDEGDFVRVGQPLFVIDPVQYKSAVTAAEAQVNVVKANLATQKLTVDNKRMLFGKAIISQYDLDLAINQMKSIEAQLEQAEANLKNAKENLSYCTVTSPSNGVVGSIPYRVGSLVSSSTQKPLTVVSNIDKMFVYFSMTENQLLDMTRDHGGINAAKDSLPEVSLVLSDGSEYNKLGRVTAISGVIEQNTGAVQMRATFDNAERLLRSGATGSILIPTFDSQAIMVPQKSTFDIQDKKFVYILNSDSTVSAREISVLVQNDGVNFVVSKGLNAGETIVLEGVRQLRAGAKITPITQAQSDANRKKQEQALKDGKLPGEN